ncbi:uncharacterized protein isoform X2 [Rhodnius prolixus]|uniref:uncharacterized protein isoform X2 n=2 Tax=Rhodnius prolixus TaxID=13249 RepID=UPI003D188EA0
MEISKNGIKSKAKMVVSDFRAVFRKQKKRRSPMNSSHKLAMGVNKSLDTLCAKKTVNNSSSKELILKNDRVKVNRIIKRFNANRESISADNIQKGRKIDTERLISIFNENEKLKKKIKNQNRQLEDLKRQLNSERSVYEDKIEYLNSISDNGSPKVLKTSSISVGVQCFSELDVDFFPIESDQGTSLDVEELHRQLYKQTLVTRCVCSKYIKLKAIKDNLVEKMIRVDNFYKLFISETLQNFEECRIAFALAQGNCLDKGSIEHLLEKNARLAYNNAAMQLELHRLEKEIKLVKSSSTINIEDEDFNIIKAVKARSNEYSVERRPSISICSNLTNNNSIRTDLTMSSSVMSLPHQQISVCGTVISVPVSVVINGKVIYRMTPMFETVTNLTESQQPVSINCDRSFHKIVEYKPELVVTPTETIRQETSQSDVINKVNCAK